MMGVVAGLALAVGMVAGAAAQETEERPRVLTVEGAGEVRGAPDTALVTVGVETVAETAGAAMADNATSAEAVFAALEAEGIDRADLQTTQFQVSPVRPRTQSNDPEPPQPEAFRAVNMISVRVREITGLGDVIDASGAAGANRIQGVQFVIADPEPLMQEARVKAVEDARARAETLAGAAGVTLGPVISIREGGGRGPMPRAEMASVAMDTPIAEGTQAVRASVVVIYAIE